MMARPAVLASMTGEERMLAACRLEAVDTTPVWFMRQAGRCLADYRLLRERYDILTIAKTPELCARVTKMPVDALGVDAAVMYADIMLPLESAGVRFQLDPEIGPIVESPIRSSTEVGRLRVADAEETAPCVFEAIRIVRRELEGRAALVGIAGGPFTLACYLIEGRPSRDYARAKALMFGEPRVWHRLMDTLAEVVARYLRGQAAAGVQVVQLFDTLIGVLAPRDYERFVLPFTARVLAETSEVGVPSIHFAVGAASLLELMAQAGGDLIGVDWRVPLDEAWRRIGYDFGIQGNLDPAVLLAPFSLVEEATQDVLHRAAGRRGHIFNLGHGVPTGTPPETLAQLVHLVHAGGRANASKLR